jgi:hypothetical protein
MKNLYLILSLICISLASQAQYCFPTYSSPCSSNDYINNVSTTGGFGQNISNLNSGCNGSAPNNYTYFINQTVAQMPGGTINFNVQSGSQWAQGFRIWVDWNQDLDFADPGEDVYVSPSVSTAPFTGSLIVPMTALPGITRMRVLCIFNSIPLMNDYCNNNIFYGECEDYNFNVITPPSCSGTPNAGYIGDPLNPNDTILLCPTASQQLYIQNYSQVTDLTFTWQQSTNFGTTWTNLATTTPYHTIAAGSTDAMYRCIVFCLNSFEADTTDSVTVIVNNPLKAPIPYVQSFESWMNGCDNNDIIDDRFWTNGQNNGNYSWRRDDQEVNGAWTNTWGGTYVPVSTVGNHSARLHTFGSTGNGELLLHCDLSSAPGTKTLKFDYIMQGGFGTSLDVDLSVNGGTSYTNLGTYASNSTVTDWTNIVLNLVTNSNDCIIRFKGTGTFSFYGDIGLDNVQILAPCVGMPNAGVIHDTTVCPNFMFPLQVDGASLAGGISYEFQSSTTGVGPWTTVATSTQNFTFTSISVPTYFRCVVSCANSSLSSTTAAQLINLNAWYYCYCNTAIPVSSFDYFDIGNVYIRKPLGAGTDTVIWNTALGANDTVNNANATSVYQSYSFSYPAKKLYIDSTYFASILDITQFSLGIYGSTRIFIDYNRDGVFDALTESAVGGNIGINDVVNGSFVVPSWAQPGLTGLRVITSATQPFSVISPCQSYFYGETEDYVVEIAQPQCGQPLSGGTAWISDTVLCSGYDVVLIDTTHTNKSSFVGLSSIWQKTSTPSNVNSWVNIAGSTGDTLIYNASGTNPIYFRYRLICSNGDTVYSDIKRVSFSPSFACYPASGAQWSSNDSSDNGAFGIGNFLFISGGGPHLGNPAAIRSRTDFTSFVIDLYEDSTYSFNFYNIIKPYNHADAKITMFIDFNGDGLYTIPNERVFSGISTANSFYLPGSYKMPKGMPLNTPFGLRIVLNNNTAPNPQSDNGVGLYTSGETEDYLVKFKKKPTAATGVTELSDLQNVNVYPNPSLGVVYIDLEASELNKLDIKVYSVTGQEVFSKGYKSVKGTFSTSLNR